MATVEAPTRVSALIVSYRSGPCLLDCLAALRAVGPPLRQVVLVDNASGDGTLDRVAAWAGRQGIELARQGEAVDRAASTEAWLVLVAARRNGGFAAGNNIGLRWIERAGGCSHVWLLNPDTRPTPDALNRMLARMAADPRIGTCGATLLSDDGSGRIQAQAGAAFDRWTGRARHIGAGRLASDALSPRAVERRLTYVMGACLLASRAYLAAAGPMDERFFLYFEEIAWQRRAGARFRTAYAPAAVVYHRHHSLAAGRDRLLFENRLRFARRYDRWRLPTVALGLVGAALKAVGRGDWARARRLASLGLWQRGLSAPAASARTLTAAPWNDPVQLSVFARLGMR